MTYPNYEPWSENAEAELQAFLAKRKHLRKTGVKDNKGCSTFNSVDVELVDGDIVTWHCYNRAFGGLIYFDGEDFRVRLDPSDEYFDTQYEDHNNSLLENFVKRGKLVWAEEKDDTFPRHETSLRYNIFTYPGKDPRAEWDVIEKRNKQQAQIQKQHETVTAIVVVGIVVMFTAAIILAAISI